MSSEKWHEKEYEKLRDELNWRIGFLHQTINLAVIILVIFVIVSFALIALEVGREVFHTFLLIVPIILIMLGFNYQSNQNSLESIPMYIESHLRPSLSKKYKQDVLGWETFFALRKKFFKLESVTKIFPFIAPSLIPFYFIFSSTPLKTYQWVMVAVDLLLLLIMIEYFRYKLKRVK